MLGLHSTQFILAYLQYGAVCRHPDHLGRAGFQANQPLLRACSRRVKTHHRAPRQRADARRAALLLGKVAGRRPEDGAADLVLADVAALLSILVLEGGPPAVGRPLRARQRKPEGY